MAMKDDIQFYKHRWEEVEAVVLQERRSLSVEQRWQQLNSAYGLAKALGLTGVTQQPGGAGQLDPGEIEVYQRWAKLKEQASNPTLKT